MSEDKLLNLVRILENLFFSLNISPDIVYKYNLLKEDIYSSYGLNPDPITVDKFPSLGVEPKNTTAFVTEVTTLLFKYGIDAFYSCLT